MGFIFEPEISVPQAFIECVLRLSNTKVNEMPVLRVTVTKTVVQWRERMHKDSL